jgi:signal transduction histidine kinase
MGESRRDPSSPPFPAVVRYVAHDLANLLTCILACADGRGSGPDRDRDLAAIRDAAKLGIELLEVLRRAPATDSCRLADALAPCRTVLERVGRARGVAVAIAVETDATLDLPGFELQELVFNLALNAIEAMSAAGGHLDVRAGVDDRGAWLTVNDDGPGFVPGQPGAPRHGHTGLGLAAVQAIVDRAGGTLAVSSEPGTGTRVGVWLPVRA